MSGSAQEVSTQTRAAGPPPGETRAEESAAPKVDVRHLDFYYGTARALKDVNLTLADRQITAFMYLGELVEVGPTEQIFTTPRDRRTDDYVTGRFG